MVVYLCSRLFSKNWNEGTIDIHQSMDESQSFWCAKSLCKEYTVYDSLMWRYRTNKNNPQWQGAG